LCDFQSSPLFSIPATASKNRARQAISFVAATEVTAKFNPARPVAGLLWGRFSICGGFRIRLGAGRQPVRSWTKGPPGTKRLSQVFGCGPQFCGADLQSG